MVSRVIAQAGEYTRVSGTVSARCGRICATLGNTQARNRRDEILPSRPPRAPLRAHSVPRSGASRRRDQRAQFRSSLERALHLPRSISDADIDGLLEATRKKAEREAGGPR